MIKLLMMIGLIGICLLTGLCSRGIANEHSIRDSLSANKEWSEDAGGNLCGIYAVARALQMLGFDTQPRSFWDARYVGNAAGSTPQELVAAIEDSGAHAVLSTNLSFLEMQVMNGPFIANVRGVVDRKAYDHWVCVVADKQGISVYDAERPPILISEAEFLSKWNGVGIVVSRSEHLWSWLIAARIATLGSSLIFGISLMKFLSKHTRTLGLFGQGVTLATTAMSISMVGYFFFGYSFAGKSHRTAMELSLAPFHDCSIHRFNLDQIEEAKSNASVLLVDARMVRDYRRGSITPAVNVPVTAGYNEVREFLAEIPRDTKIFTFCHSVRCDYDTVVAKRLCAMGFTNVQTCEEGYVEYTNR